MPVQQNFGSHLGPKLIIQGRQLDGVVPPQTLISRIGWTAPAMSDVKPSLEQWLLEDRRDEFWNAPRPHRSEQQIREELDRLDAIIRSRTCSRQ
ncbi:hypothetical protein BDY21DRAFT_180015 [Lineolata rhizophorae]|uniref:Uncharacterized protein n=1 Tax=Lineolata rhizophorae TaxID=578093 RepID=A0A6A6P7N4_9PEZI|nr:hypothetical protein BDY21DRAFT_180015 [Lineolata rhizophorae]